jgi:hypothetical protein
MSLPEMIKLGVDRGRTGMVKRFGTEQPENDPFDQLLRQDIHRLVSDQHPPLNGKIRLLQAAVQQKRAMEAGEVEVLGDGLSAGYPDPRVGPHEVLASYLALAFHHSHVRLVA